MQEGNCSSSSLPRTELAAEELISQTFDLPAAFMDRASLAIKVILQDRFHGATVALSPIVCQDVISAVISAGCRPLFVDLDPSTTEVPASEWERARDDGAIIAIVVHLFGLGRSLTDVRRVFTGDGCLVIDDAAQAVGTTVGTQFAGTLGDIGILSFGYSKQLPMGGAAVLTRDDAVLNLIRQNRLSATATNGVAPQDGEFRKKLDQARGQLAQWGRRAASEFEGLLEGYEDSLNVAAPANAARMITESLPQLGEFRDKRMRKLRLWKRLLTGSGAEFFESPDGTNPWRAVFRLRGIGWEDQATLADEIRSTGVPLSTWYLPGHWFLDGGETVMEGAEQLSREVFQLWIDEATTERQIRSWAPSVRKVLQSSARRRAT